MIGAYHQLWHIEKSFRMSKHDLQARPIYHHKRESIEAHLTIVFAALAVTRVDRGADRLVHQEIRQDRPPLPHHRDPGRRARSITAADPLPDDLRHALDAINRSRACALGWPNSGGRYAISMSP